MPRPRKCRQISSPPEVATYKPAGVPARLLQWVTLTLDEYHAIRQIDYNGLDQDSVAAEMGVSRPTVTRIYRSARKKMATVLVEGMALKIEGGPVSHADPAELPPHAMQPPHGPPGRGRRRGMGRGGCGRGRQQGQ